MRVGTGEESPVASRVAGYGVAASGGPSVAASDGVVRELNRVFVRFTGGTSGERRARFRRSLGARVVRAYGLVPGLQLLEVPGPGNAASSARSLARSQHSTVSYAVPDVAYRVQALPDDPLYGEQWGMPSIGAPEAWARSTGSKSVVVAVMDTGIDLDHPDLQANIWTNPDPGQDGYTDDVHGWNFVADDNDPNDDYGHGTHVAGIIGAVGDNGIGVSGVSWSVSLMPLKICGATGLCEASAEIAALEYAVEHGAKIANASFGAADGGYPPEEEAIKAAGKAGLLFVAGAGNQESDNDGEPFYPASYPLENIISVTASTPSETLAGFANFGADSVGLAAPGENILSTLPQTGAALTSPTGYGLLSGTSMAAPQVTGAAALLWSMHPSWTMQQIRARILRSARAIPALFGKVSSCGELDVGAASDPEVPELASLCVQRSGSGSGSVSSSPAGLQCGSSCTEKVSPGTKQTLTATPAAGSTFAGWSGACTGTAACVVATSLGASVTARFDAAGAPAGWEERALAAPKEREPFLSGSVAGVTFYNVALSADGSVRAKTIFDEHESECSYVSSDTGGIFMERDTPAGWVSEGRLTAPALGSGEAARWANCSEYGALTELSGDGSTLLVAPKPSQIGGNNSDFHCAAFVYRHEAGGWKLDGTLFPPGVGVEGSPDAQGCGHFGVAGAISDDGDTVVVRDWSSVDVFTRASDSGWMLGQHIALPAGTGCQGSLAPRQLAMSGDGKSMLVGDPECAASGPQAVGRVYAYTETGGSWSLSQVIDAPEQQFQNYFGSSVAISDDGNTATVRVGPNVTGLSKGADAAWVFERVGEHWQAEQRLTAPVDEEEVGLECPAIIENGLRIVCVAANTVGLDSRQGVVYFFERPPSGWGAPASTPMSMFASEGAAGDRLGRAGYLGWSSLAVAADGSLIDATISPANLADHLYTDNRIGYEFTAPMPPAPTISGLSVTAGTVASQVTITGANLRGTTGVSFGGGEATQYRIDSATEITATVPEDAKAGPIAVTTRAGTAISTRQFTVLASLSTTASPPVAVGEAIQDSATLLGGSSPTGTIAFELYAAGDTGCHQPLLAQPLSANVAGDGHYTSPPLSWDTPGAYQWVASYSGDAHNDPVAGTCGDPSEQLTVKARPSLTQSASPSAVAGETIQDSASLTGGSAPTGTISFQLYAASDTQCAQPLLAEPLSVAVTGDGPYTSPPLLQGTPGDYQWVATYSGDTYNMPVTSACDEPRARVLVKERPPALAILAESALQPTPTGVLLSAAVNPGGQHAAYHFEYGLDPSYGSSTPETQVAAGESEVAVGPTAVGGLQPGATYHYRLVLVGATGMTFGPDETFTTPGVTLLPEEPGLVTQPPIPGPPPNTTAASLFSDLSLRAARNPRRMQIRLTVNVAGSKIAVKATAPSSPGKHSKRRVSKPMVVASLIRADAVAGRLELNVPLNAKAKLALQRRGNLRVTVEVTVTPPTGRPQTATGMVSAKLGTSAR
jgi:subtilisin family serine protease